MEPRQFTWSTAVDIENGGRPTLSLFPLSIGNHPFGQDEVGRDIFAVVMRGTQQSLMIMVIVGSIACCLFTLLLLRGVREPAARAMRDLVNVMWHMREFNPMLAATSMAEYMFTPRGLNKLARSSLRTFRRHTSVMGDVGEELMDGGLRIIRSKIKRDGTP